MSELQAVFRRPFAEQVAAFRLRLGDLVPTARWNDLWKSQHDRAFMVAGATKADLLADLARAVDKAIAEGTSLEVFRRDFREAVEKHGWHGWTGEDTPQGRAWRTRVIYQTNMRTSYQAGRWAQLKKAGFKYWVYRHGGSENPRLHHLAWDGLILEADHPFWSTHYPPNGWGCSCYVRGARTLAGAKRLGGDPSVTLPDNWRDLDPKTGEPSGIGKGWGYAPGASVASDVAVLAPKLEKLPEQPSIDLIRSWLSAELFGAWLANPVGAWPLLRISQDQAARIGSTKMVANMTGDVARQQLRRHPELDALDYLRAQDVVSNADRVIAQRRALIFVWQPPGDRDHVWLMRAVRRGEDLLVTGLQRVSADPAVRDRAIADLRAHRD